MAIVFVIQKWRPYLLGMKFLVRNDQRSLKYLLEQRAVSEDHQKWLSKILGYNFHIVYRTGKEKSVADALSCREVSVQLWTIASTCNINWHELWKEVEHDEEL